VDSYEHLINLKRQRNIDNLQKSGHYESDPTEKKVKDLVNSICKHQRPYIKKSLCFLLEQSLVDTETLCRYIIAEQNEINIKESTKEGKIKILVDLAKFLDFKDFYKVTKEDVFSYLNKYRKPDELDPNHRWIGTWNNRHLILLKFFRWLYN
jgi:hypothetical protein